MYTILNFFQEEEGWHEGKVILSNSQQYTTTWTRQFSVQKGSVGGARITSENPVLLRGLQGYP